MTTALPAASVSEFHDKQKSYALIIGVYNEGDKFSHQLLALQPYRELADIIIADGKSTDGATSKDILKNKTRTLLVNEGQPRGLSVQYRMAIEYAMKQGYEGIVMMDGNGKDGVDAVPRFVEKLKEGFDFVQGSRFLPGGQHEHTPIDRVLGIRLIFSPIMSLASGFFYTDAMNGFKACSHAFLSDPRVQPLRDIFIRYSLQYYFNYIAPRLKFRVAEIPVTRTYPTDGSSYSKIGGLRGRIKILGELLGTITGRYNV